jgi:hypothetical protein
MQGALEGAAGAPLAELAAALDALGVACALEGSEGLVNCEIFGCRDGVDALSSACLSLLHSRSEVLASALNALTQGLRSAENRDRIGLRGLLAVFLLLGDRAADGAVQAAALRTLAAAMLGHEANRAVLHDKCAVIPAIAAALRTHADDREVVLGACGALRALTLQDDGRVALNKGFDRARAAAEHKCLPLLAAQLEKVASGDADLPLACALLNTLSRLTASAKICRRREGWAGLGWAGLGWAGLGWAGRAGLGRGGLGVRWYLRPVCTHGGAGVACALSPSQPRCHRCPSLTFATLPPLPPAPPASTALLSSLRDIARACTGPAAGRPSFHEVARLLLPHAPPGTCYI